jgi:hypothetical protein
MSLKSSPSRMGILALSLFTLDAITKVLAFRLASAGSGRDILLPLQTPEFSLGLGSASFAAMRSSLHLRYVLLAIGRLTRPLPAASRQDLKEALSDR